MTSIAVLNLVALQVDVFSFGVIMYELLVRQVTSAVVSQAGDMTMPEMYAQKVSTASTSYVPSLSSNQAPHPNVVSSSAWLLLLHYIVPTCCGAKSSTVRTLFVRTQHHVCLPQILMSKEILLR